MKFKFTLTALLISCLAFAQNSTKRTLFLGNSYTYVNNLPQMLASVATSTNDTLIYDSNTIGGYTLSQHSVDANSLNKIAAGNWDYVVLQEQSQLPSFPLGQVQNEVFPYAQFLDSTINADNPCAETVFYMTWGRKNGDASNCAGWAPVCTYQGMDSLLNLRYRMMAEDNNAILSPVGAVWHYVRDNFPLIELYQGDESHPSVAGTYVAACCFYASLFRKDPSLITYNPSLPDADAQNIRNAARFMVFDSLMNWHIGEYDPTAAFTYTNSGANEVAFNNVSQNATEYFWDFGDGDTSTAFTTTHIFADTGTYNVTLIVSDCGKSDTLTQAVTLSLTGNFENINNQHTKCNIYPNPVKSNLTVSSAIAEITTYKILNVSGNEVLNGTLTSSQQQIDVSSLSGGLYFLQLYNSAQFTGQQKFIRTTD